MASSIYLASAESHAGKSAVAVGLLDQLGRRAGRVGIFRPVVRDAVPREAECGDRVVDLLISRLPHHLRRHTAWGVTYDDLHADPDRAMSTIVERFHRIARHHDVVLIVGSDFTDVASPTEFSDNARIAANLGAPMVLVLSGVDRTPADLAVAAGLVAVEAGAHHARVVAVVANQVAPADLASVRTALDTLHLPAYAIPRAPLLDAPTVDELMAACHGTLIYGDPALLEREALGTMVAAMTAPNVLDRLVPGGVVVTPSDREDVVLAVLLAHHSTTYPTQTAIVVNGGFPLPPQVRQLIAGLDVTLPVIATDGDTMATARALADVRGTITAASTRKIETAIETVGRHVDAEALLALLDVEHSDVVTPLMFEHRLVERARAAQAHIVLPEGDEDRILAAADILLTRQVTRITLLGNPVAVRAKAARLGLDITDATVLDPAADPLRERFAQEYAARRAHKGITVDTARDIVVDPSYFGTMMVLLGLADGMVSGSAGTTAHTIRPALEVIKTVEGTSVVSSVFLMCLADKVLVYGDCAVNPDPTAGQLADIAISSARTAATFGIEPRVAMLSYSTGRSGTGADVDKVRTATALVRERAPELSVDGPIQYEAAVDVAVAQAKLTDSAVAGRATVLIFPDLNTGNNTYKAVQRSAAAVAIGPVLQGLRKPVNDLSRGALVRDIVNTVAITAIQAEASR